MRKQDIKEAESKMSEENEAFCLEKKANEIRAQIIEEQEVNNSYIMLTSELVQSGAGTLNLDICQEAPIDMCTCKCTLQEHKEHKIALQRAAMYRDMAEKLQTENRKLYTYGN